MAIQDEPPPGTVLLCDHATGFRPPDMVKPSPAVVVSPRLRARRGLCTAVPLSTSAARDGVRRRCRVTLPSAPPQPFGATELWAKADMLATAGLERHDLFRSGRNADGRRKYLKLALDRSDLDAVRTCICIALDL